MSWSGGTYSKGNSGTGGWAGDAASGIGIEAGRHDTQDNDFATGINNCIAKDGQNTPTNDLPMGGYHHTGVSNATANDQYTAWGQLRNGAPVYLDTANTRVGIGTSSPASVLDIQSTANEPYIQQFSANTNGPRISLRKSRNASVGGNTIVSSGDTLGSIAFWGANGTGYTAGALIACDVDGTPGAANDMPGNLKFYTTPDGSGTVTERMRISNSGNVGIGTTAPSVALDVLGNVRLADVETDATVKVGRIKGRSYTNSQGDWMVLDAQGLNADNQIVMGGGSGVNNCATTLRFITAANTTTVSGTERMRITSAGNVGIGTAAPVHQLSVVSASATVGACQLYTNATGDAANLPLSVIKYDATSTAGANYLIGFWINQGATASGRIAVNGANAAAFFSTSDIRVKENIVDLPSQLNNILSLRPVEFDFKDGSGHQIGFIAQEVEAIYPDTVATDADGMKSLGDMSKSYARLVKAFQELNANVESLKARVTALENA